MSDTHILCVNKQLNTVSHSLDSIEYSLNRDVDRAIDIEMVYIKTVRNRFSFNQFRAHPLGIPAWCAALLQSWLGNLHVSRIKFKEKLYCEVGESFESGDLRKISVFLYRRSPSASTLCQKIYVCSLALLVMLYMLF